MFPLVHKNDILLQDLIDQDHGLMESNGHDPCNKVTRKRQRESISNSKPISIQEKKVEESNELNHRKIMHRDIERQRRQQMGTLYASLRSLLPPEYIQGKRSISDHMHEAVNYIQHMQKNIKDLQMRKNKLIKKNMASSGGFNGSENGSSDIIDGLPNFVTVNCLSHGVEILINSGINEEGFPLSRVLLELIQTGLNVISCVSTNTNQRILYRIESEAVDLNCINLSVLQQRLTTAINFG